MVFSCNNCILEGRKQNYMNRFLFQWWRHRLPVTPSPLVTVSLRFGKPPSPRWRPFWMTPYETVSRILELTFRFIEKLVRVCALLLNLSSGLCTWWMCGQGCIRCNYRCARKASDRILAHLCHHVCKSVIERLACASTLNPLASIITCVFRTRMNFISRVKKCIVTRSLYCILKNGQVVSGISVCRTLFGDCGMSYYLKFTHIWHQFFSRKFGPPGASIHLKLGQCLVRAKI